MGVRREDLSLQAQRQAVEKLRLEQRRQKQKSRRETCIGLKRASA